MKTKIKKLSIVLYCNGNFDETKDTFFSILDQKISHLFYDVLIINDNAQKAFTNKLNQLIQKEELSNFKVYSLESYSGLPMSFNFLLKNNIIQTKYVTIVKSGDVIKDGWFDYFLNHLYSKDKDLYMSDINSILYIPKDNIDDEGKKYRVEKSKIIISAISGEISQNEAIYSQPAFLGKIWRTQAIQNIKIDDDKILYQDIFMYLQMILHCKDIWYEAKTTGVMKHKSWLPNKMDRQRLELLILTINKMISRNPYVNGHILQLFAQALEKTDDELKKIIVLTNHKYLIDNYNIIKIYHLSKRKVLKLTKPFIENGEIVQKS